MSYSLYNDEYAILVFEQLQVRIVLTNTNNSFFAAGKLTLYVAYLIKHPRST